MKANRVAVKFQFKFTKKKPTSSQNSTSKKSSAKKNSNEFAEQRVLWERAYYPLPTGSATLTRLLVAGAFMYLVCLAGTLAFWYLGQGAWSWWQCLYMVIITITTVGYGEVIPVSETTEGLIITMIVMIGGLGVSFYFLSALTAFIIEGDLREVIWRRRMGHKINNLSGHYIVCGAGEVGHNVIIELFQARHDLVVIDLVEDNIAALSRRLGTEVMSLIGDATEDEVLQVCGIDRAAGIVSALKNDRDNLFVVVTARQLNHDIRIIARATNERSASKMRHAGADAVVCPNTIGGLRMASELLRPAVVGFIDLIVRDSEDNQLSVEEFVVPSNSPVQGLALSQSGIRQVSNSLVLSIVYGEKQFFNPPPTIELREGMIIVALGEVDELSCLRRYIAGEVVLVTNNGKGKPRVSS